MKADAILKVTQAFRQRLETALKEVVDQDSVFVGPLDDPQVGAAALILFLYRIAPNPNLRNSVHRIPPNPIQPDPAPGAPLSTKPPEAQTFQNALPLDLYYLVSVGSTNKPNEEQGHYKLGLALQKMQNEPVLTGPAVEYETVRVTLEPLTTEDLSRIWSLFPAANYRTSIAFLASPVWVDPIDPDKIGKRVHDDSLIAGPKAVEVGV